MNQSKPSLIPSIYGYLVCVISIIVALIAISMLVTALFDSSSPLRSNRYYGGYSGNLSSYESYAIEQRAMRPVDATGKEMAKEYTDAELRTMYDAAKADRIEGVRFDASKEITTASLMLIIAAALFGFHWNWLRRSNAADLPMA